MSALPMKRIDAPRRRQSRDISTGLERRRRGRRARAKHDPRRGLVRRDGLTTAELPVATSTPLRVVPRRRVAANIAAVVVVVVGVLMLSAVVLQTRMTERQAEIDRLAQQVSGEHARFEVLRQHRAALRSPMRLSDEAARLGMAQATTATFTTLDPIVLARVLAATGIVDASARTVSNDHDPLAQVRRVRAAAAGVDPNAPRASEHEVVPQ